MQSPFVVSAIASRGQETGFLELIWLSKREIVKETRFLAARAIVPRNRDNKKPGFWKILDSRGDIW
ncbi:MAG: hypothetical protein GDA56_25805 [Hormoscilla sp. GM7CHS1pb]|nr:hypothetical protein [Hormoscilla sp. GM7CHS1pb]